MLATALREEEARLDAPDALPVHLRLAPPLEHPDDVGGDVFVTQLLAPVRAGMILVRDDLVAAARELGMGGRIAERRFALRALLDQDAAATLAWLGRHAGRAGRSTTGGMVTPVFWRERARSTATLLARLATAATPQEVTTHAG